MRQGGDYTQQQGWQRKDDEPPIAKRERASSRWSLGDIAVWGYRKLEEGRWRLMRAFRSKAKQPSHLDAAYQVL